MTNSAFQHERGESIRAAGKSVYATLNYVANMDQRPVYYMDDPAGGSIRFDPREVVLEDASLLSRPPRLDVEGFQLFHHQTSQRNLSEMPETAIEPYSLELEALLLEAMGADYVHVNRGHLTRHQQQQQQGLGTKIRQGPPAAFIHSDTSPAHGPTYVGMQGGEPAAGPIKRMAMLNQWRLISPPPTNLPLAFLDKRTISPDDIVLAESTFTDRHKGSLEIVVLRYNPEHRWYFFSQMGYDDLLVFKQFDSDPSYPCFIPHTAFFNSTVEGKVQPRINYETRAAAYWYA